MSRAADAETADRRPCWGAFRRIQRPVEWRWSSSQTFADDVGINVHQQVEQPGTSLHEGRAPCGSEKGIREIPSLGVGQRF